MILINELCVSILKPVRYSTGMDVKLYVLEVTYHVRWSVMMLDFFYFDTIPWTMLILFLLAFLLGLACYNRAESANRTVSYTSTSWLHLAADAWYFSIKATGICLSGNSINDLGRTSESTCKCYLVWPKSVNKDINLVCTAVHENCCPETHCYTPIAAP